MSEASHARPAPDRLDSWKEIAGYLNRDVTTVQRWEKREGMPVHRHQHEKVGSVYAFRTELDAWVRERKLVPEAAVELQPVGRPPRDRWRYPVAIVAIVAMILSGIVYWTIRTERFWNNPIADAEFQQVTDFDGIASAATVSRDGHFIAFLSDRDGRMDLWVTQTGSGEFHNLTNGTAPELVNSSVRTLGFSPDDSVIVYWTRKPSATAPGDIGLWAVPTLGGQPRPYREDAAELDWSPDGTKIAYHTPGPGDPLFVTQPGGIPDKPVFSAPPGLHSHFPLWSPDGNYIYFVQGSLPDHLDIWRIPSIGGTPERITSHNSRVTYPAFLDRSTLLYLATDPEGSGPWLYSIDVEHRVPHQLSSAPNRYTSLAATADGRHLVLSLANPKRSLWRLAIAESPQQTPSVSRISLTTTTGTFPRLGPDFLLYIASTPTSASLWKVAAGTSTELWKNDDTQFVGAPTVSRDGNLVAFPVRQRGNTLLYVVNVDGTNAHVIADTLRLEGNPAWSPDGKYVTIGANGGLYRVPLNGERPRPIVEEYASDPVWSPDGKFVVYSGPDIGTTFSIKAATPEGKPYPLPELTLTRGARHLAFLPGGKLAFLRGQIDHKDVWSIDLSTGSEQQLTNLPANFDVRDFEVSRDGREVVLERVEERSDVVMMDLKRR